MAVDQDIQDAAAAIVTALAIPGAAVRTRKTPARVEGETVVLNVSVTEEERFEPATADDDHAWFGYYRLVIALGGPTGMKLADGSTIRGYRQSIRRAITQPAMVAAGATLVDDVDPVGRPAFDHGLLDDNVDWAVVAFQVRTLEPRV